MNNNELINEFLDGGMLPADEDKFLMMMAGSDDLKSEFKRAMFIESTLKEEAASIAPSTKSTMQLFSTLGINYTNIIEGKTFYQKSAEVLSKYIRKAAPSIITAILVSAAVSWYFIENNNQSLIVPASQPATANTARPMAQSYSHGFPLMSSFAFENSGSGFVQKQDNSITDNEVKKNTPKVVATDNSEDGNSTSANIISHIMNEQPVEFSSIDPGTKDTDIDFRLTPANIRMPGGINPVTLNSAVKYSGYSVTFTGSEDKSLKNVTYAESSHPVFSRNGLEIMYAVDEGVQIGLDLRQEYFFQDFKKFDENHVWSQYYQHPNFFTTSVAARFRISKLFDKTNLIGKVGLGINKAGPVFREMIGLEYEATDRIGLTLGIENSNLVYSEGNAVYITPKLGLTYGVKLNL